MISDGSVIPKEIRRTFRISMGDPSLITFDTGYGVLHERGIRCGKVHRRNMKDGYPAVFVQRHDSRFYGRTE